MIEASFDSLKSNKASATGAVQYDTGQRIRLRGLPSPEELAEKDDFLSGDVVTVQVQFAYEGDQQSEGRFATYDAWEEAWMADVPNAYLTRNRTVLFYVYVGYGADESTNRNETQYMGSYTPTSRPAPSDKVTQDQLNAWDVLVSEVNLAISNAAQAASNANAAASNASGWGNATVSAKTLPAGSNATVSVTNAGGVKNLEYGIPKGEKGDKGDKGDPGAVGPAGPTGPAGVTFRLEGTTLYIDTV